MKTAGELVGIILEQPSIIRTSSQAKQIHAQIIKRQGHTNSFAKSAAIVLSIYANFNLYQDCLSLFNSFRHPPPSKAWKSIIRCCASVGNFEESVAFLKRMMAAGLIPDRNVFPSLLKTCAHLGDLRFGEALHGCVVRLGLDSDLFTGNALMNMYVKLESMNARNVFDDCSQPKGPFEFYRCLSRTGNGNSAVYVQDSKEGFDHVHEKTGFSNHTNLDSERQSMTVVRREISNDNVKSEVDHSDVKIAAVSSSLERRKNGVFPGNSVGKVFDSMPVRDAVSWNTVIGGQVQNGMYEEALMTMKDMVKENSMPNTYTLSTILPIFAKYADVTKGKEVYAYAIRHGYDKDAYISNSLIAMYANCLQLEDSYKVFTSSPRKDTVSWNSMIAACVQNGRFEDGLRYFREMMKSCFEPLASSFSSVMPVCAHLTTLSLGKQLHAYVIRRGFDDNIYVTSSLLDMYAKCGNIKTAKWIFENMEFHDMVSWTAMIMAYAYHGHGYEAISFFEKMERDGIKPNSCSFLAVLTACSHGGLVDEARMYFERMMKDCGILPEIEHYAAVSDVLGRVGRLDEAYEFINSMHIEPTEAIWKSLLSACSVHKNVEMAENVAKEILSIDPKSVSAYVLLSNAYVAVGRWKEAAKLRNTMRKKGVKKEVACSWC